LEKEGEEYSSNYDNDSNDKNDNKNSHIYNNNMKEEEEAQVIIIIKINTEVWQTDEAEKKHKKEAAYNDNDNYKINN